MICNTCGEDFPPTEEYFYIHSTTNKPIPHCKECKRRLERERKAKSPQKKNKKAYDIWVEVSESTLKDLSSCGMMEIADRNVLFNFVMKDYLNSDSEINIPHIPVRSDMTRTHFTINKADFNDCKEDIKSRVGSATNKLVVNYLIYWFLNKK